MTATLLVLIALLAAPTTQPQSSADRLAAARAELEAAGAPTTLNGFADLFPPVPDDRNAAVEIEAAGEALSTIESEAWVTYDYTHNTALPPLPGGQRGPGDPEPTPWPVAVAAVDDYAAVYAALDGIDAKIRPAVDRVQADFGLDWRGVEEGLAINILMPALNDARELANRLKLRALVLTHLGRHDAVARPMLRAIGIADAIDATHTVLSGHLTALGIDALAAETLARVAPHQSIGDGPGEMPPADARTLIGVLLDDGPRDAGFADAIRGEVIFQQTAVDHVLEAGKLGKRDLLGLPVRMTLKPIIRDKGVIMAELMLPFLDAPDWPNHPAAEPVVREYERRARVEVEQNLPYYQLAAIMLPAMERAVEAQYRNRNARRLAAVSLAVQLYRADHDGDLPPALDALVPDYLPAVPADAMTADGSVKYDPARGLAWTVGEDGVDHGGRSREDVERENPDATSPQIDRTGYDEVVRLR